MRYSNADPTQQHFICLFLCKWNFEREIEKNGRQSKRIEQWVKNWFHMWNRDSNGCRIWNTVFINYWKHANLILVNNLNTKHKIRINNEMKESKHRLGFIDFIFTQLSSGQLKAIHGLMLVLLSIHTCSVLSTEKHRPFNCGFCGDPTSLKADWPQGQKETIAHPPTLIISGQFS